MLSFSSVKDMNSLASDGDPKESCFNQPPSGEDSEASFLEFEKACSGLISNLERLAQKPRKKRKREYNPTKVLLLCYLIKYFFNLNISSLHSY